MTVWFEHGRGVQEWGLAGHRHGFLDLVHLQQKIGARGRLCVNNNVLDGDGAEAGELPCDGVAPGHQPRELIGSSRIGHGDLVAADRAGISEGNGHARHDGARRVRCGTADRAETALREGSRRRTQAHE